MLVTPADLDVGSSLQTKRRMGGDGDGEGDDEDVVALRPLPPSRRRSIKETSGAPPPAPPRRQRDFTLRAVIPVCVESNAKRIFVLDDILGTGMISIIGVLLVPVFPLELL